MHIAVSQKQKGLDSLHVSFNALAFRIHSCLLPAYFAHVSYHCWALARGRTTNPIPESLRNVDN